MEHTQTPQSLFEKYQTFIAIIICGALIGGGIVIAKLLPTNGTVGVGNAPQTAESVRADMVDAAKKIGVNKTKFAACLDDVTNTARVTAAVELAGKSGVQGTPTFFVIKRTYGADDKITSEKQFMILGARDLVTFETSLSVGKPPVDQPPQPVGEKIILSAEDHWMGPRRAETILVEYSDIDCPYCKKAKPIIDELLQKHPEYALVYRHSPIASLHPFAAYKAEASECAAQLSDQESFFKFLDIVAK